MLSCIVCKNILNNFTEVYNKVRDDITGDAKIVKCNICGHIQTDGSRNNLKEHYENDLQSLDENGKLRYFSIEDIIKKETVEINRRIDTLNIDFSNKNILDIGSGYCTFAKILLDKYENVNIVALEPSKTRSDKGILIHNKKINVINSYLDDTFVSNNLEKFDYITLWHVLEHIDETNIDLVLNNALKILKKNGKFIIEVPNGNDELFKFDKYKNINYMVHHISYFTESTLTKLFNSLNINKFKISFVQRYGFKNYLNWVYNLDYNLKDDMFKLPENDYERIWYEGKIKNKNTDAIMIVINK